MGLLVVVGRGSLLEVRLVTWRGGSEKMEIRKIVEICRSASLHIAPFFYLFADYVKKSMTIFDGFPYGLFVCL